MSYYLDFAQSIKKDNPEAARVIEELYAAKVELEETVKRISDARDLLLKENAEREAAIAERRRRWDDYNAEKATAAQKATATTEHLRGWFEVQQDRGGDWTRVPYLEADHLCRHGKDVRYCVDVTEVRENNPTIETDLMGEKIKGPGWYEKEWDGNGEWTLATYQEARMLQPKGWSIRFRNRNEVLVVWPFNQLRREGFANQKYY